jgi:hypothetical protein
MVELAAQAGASTPYRDVLVCSLWGEAVTCEKGCLISPAVLRAPIIVMRSERLRICLLMKKE